MNPDDDEESRNYEVGYGLPPLATRFQKGKSGNPRGRPPRRKTRRAIVEQIASAKIHIVEGGKRREVTRLQAIVLISKAKAIAGNQTASRLCDKLRGIEEEEDDAPIAKGVLILGEKLTQDEWEEKFVPK